MQLGLNIHRIRGAFTCRLALLVASGALAACLGAESSNGGPSTSMSKEECREADVCELVGHLARSSDGHAWIGRFTLDSGECVNVSIPDQGMEALSESGEERVRLSGRVVLYPIFELEADLVVTSFALSGRKIGIGNCGDFFVFVETMDDYAMEIQP